VAKVRAQDVPMAGEEKLICVRKGGEASDSAIELF